jgi:prepilin-type N-terminal cleavage/methylation domain-containing protein
MKNKAFTLIELIAVLVIMSIITLLATPNIISLMDKGKEDSFKSEIKTTVTKAINKHKSNIEVDRFELTQITSEFDLESVDPYGYTYDRFNIEFSYDESAPGELPTPTSREISIDVRSCKGGGNSRKCHCVATGANKITRVEEIDDLDVVTGGSCNNG